MPKNKGKKRKHAEVLKPDESEVQPLPAVRSSDEPAPKKARRNKEKVLIFSSRGVSYRDRHLMKDLKTMLPHSSSENKLERKDNLFIINEICELKHCSKCLFFEAKKRKDLYMWMACTPTGPSAKFLIENVHTMQELNFPGNCLRGSRPLLSFDKNFDDQPHLKLLREMFTQIFCTPKYHPRSQPFVDHVLTFSFVDQRVWLRNYQIAHEQGEVVEIGPRMVINPIRIFEGSFRGQTLYSNSLYVSPNLIRREARRAAGMKYSEKQDSKKAAKQRKSDNQFMVSDLQSEIFAN